MSIKSFFKNDKEIHKEGYEKGMFLVYWRLQSFQILYQDLRKSYVQPSQSRGAVPLNQLTDVEHSRAVTEAKLTGTFLVAFSTVESLLHSIANLVLYRNSICTSSILKEKEIKELLEKDYNVGIQKKPKRYLRLLAKVVAQEILNEIGEQEWNSRVDKIINMNGVMNDGYDEVIKIRHQITHAKARFSESEGELGGVEGYTYPPHKSIHQVYFFLFWILYALFQIDSEMLREYLYITEILKEMWPQIKESLEEDENHPCKSILEDLWGTQ